MTINEYQEKVYQEILNELRDNNIVRIYGPSGVGKTTLINRFNQEKLSFFSFSEMDKDDDSLFSLVVSSSSFGNKLKNTDDTVSNLFEIDKLSVFKGPLKILFDIFSKTAAVSHKLNNFFSDQEINIIISLMKFTEKANKSNFYLVFDNCEYMNDRSAKFIRRLFINNDIEDAKAERREPELLPHFSCHHLRHTFCTRFCENETNLKIIQEIMGHADITTTMDIYNEATKQTSIFLLKQSRYTFSSSHTAICICSATPN